LEEVERKLGEGPESELGGELEKRSERFLEVDCSY
jgi:hypothetical protein